MTNKLEKASQKYGVNIKENPKSKCTICKINNGANTLVTVSRMNNGIKEPWVLIAMCVNCAENYLENHEGICSYSDCTKKASLATVHVMENFFNIDLFCSKQCKKTVIKNYQSQNETPPKPETLCKVCHRVGKEVRKCGRCQKVYYCGPKCQRKDWSKHKITCVK